MPRFFSLLFGAYFFASSFFLMCITATICFFEAPFDPNRHWTHVFASLWGHHYVRINPFWKITIEGTELIDPKKTYVLVANHQSYWDIMLMYGIFKPFKWVSKEEIFSVPFIGTNMVINQYVRLRRGDRKSIMEMMDDCRKWLKQGVSIAMYPEGTRSEDGEIQEFRDGSFKLAIESNVPVVPIVINGTREIYPKNARALALRGHMHLKVLPPVTPESCNNSVREMRDHVRGLMVETLNEMRGRPGGYVSETTKKVAREEAVPEAAVLEAAEKVPTSEAR